MKAVRKPEDDALRERENVASATECTGLMPALPRGEAEDEVEARLYAIHSAKKGGGERRPKE